MPFLPLWTLSLALSGHDSPINCTCCLNVSTCPVHRLLWAVDSSRAGQPQTPCRDCPRRSSLTPQPTRACSARTGQAELIQQG